MERSDNGDERFKFTGKEQDAETDFNYFGARYYDAGVSVWLSVDPLTIKYPFESPYIYCGNSPITRFDAFGLDHWKIKKNGKAKLVDTKGDNIYVNGALLSEYDFSDNPEAAATILSYYYNKNFSKNKYHLAKGKVSIAVFENGKYKKEKSFNVDKKLNFRSPAKASTLSARHNSDKKNRIYFFLEDGKLDDDYNNKYNLISTVSHERTHLIQGVPTSNTRIELQAYYKQMEHSSWEKTSDGYKTFIEANVTDYIRQFKAWGWYTVGISEAAKQYYQEQYRYYKKLFSKHFDTSGI